MLALIATVLSFLSMANWHVDESYNVLDLQNLVNQISLFAQMK